MNRKMVIILSATVLLLLLVMLARFIPFKSIVAVPNQRGATCEYKEDINIKYRFTDAFKSLNLQDDKITINSREDASCAQVFNIEYYVL